MIETNIVPITPATAGVEPLALLVRKNSWRDGQWEAAPPNSPSYGLAWADQRVYVYATPQPVARESLADEQFGEICDRLTKLVREKRAKHIQRGIDAGAEYYIGDAAHHVGHVVNQAAHGIKGAQHGTE